MGVNYPTTLINDGARHPVSDEVYLGAAVDSETDGQPDGNATGDDLTGGADDEDGVITGTLTSGGVDTVLITASTTGYVDAWVDFNRDGDWDDDGEHVLDTVLLSAGINAKTISVPAISGGDTFARFRFRASSSELDPTGLGDEGEVEDYKVTVVAGESTPVQSSSSSSSSSSDTGDTQGGGSGHGTTQVQVSLGITLANLGFGQGTPPPAFGGDGELSEEAKKLFCWAQGVIADSPALREFIIAQLMNGTGWTEAFVIEQLDAAGLCNGVSGLPPRTVVEKPRQVQLAEDGYPLSSNRVWNLCVRGKATLADIRANTDVWTSRLSHKQVAKSCDAYKLTGTDTWKYPDDPYLTFTIHTRPGLPMSPVVLVPNGFVAIPAPQQTAAAETTQQ